MAINNPRKLNLITLIVKIRKTGDFIRYLFPLNPSSLTINQANRVSATFTYGGKVFQNLGAGLKTLSIEGHTGYRISKDAYGLISPPDASSLAVQAVAKPLEGPPLRTSSAEPPPSDGKIHWLDLYALIQLIKGENKFITSKTSSIGPDFSVDNIDNIETVSIAIPDQGITYDVLLQNDSFMRNREQPNLYKYKLDFIVTNESLGQQQGGSAYSTDYPDTSSLVSSVARQATLLSNVKQFFMGLPGVQTVSDLVDKGMKYVENTISEGNYFINSVNSSINDLRRLERMTESLNNITKNLSLVRNIVQQIKTFSDLQTAFYEPYIRLKNISQQMSLLKSSMQGDQQNLSFNVSMTQLASVSAPVTIAANKATVAQFQKDIRQLNTIAFPFPVEKVQEVTTNGATKINVFFKTAPSSLAISDIKVFTTNDFGNENNLVESLDDSKMVLSTSYAETGFFYNFTIEYNYTSFESIIQPRYKSIKRIAINKGDTLESIVKRFAPNEANASRAYYSEVAYLNNIEYPYIVTTDNPNYEAYFGSYGYKIFSTNGEFMQYIYNINTLAYPGPNMPLYDSSIASTTEFLLQEPNVVTQIQTTSKFFVMLFKETYSDRCYALFGMTNAATCTLFTAESYILCALDKGRTYDIDNNTIFEILSPYTLTSDIIDFYGQRNLADSIETSAALDLFDKDITIINAIYSENVGAFWIAADYPFTTYDHEAADQYTENVRFQNQKIFLSGDEDNANYVILTNFTATGAASISDYSIAAFSKYSVLSDGQEILLPSLEDKFLPFTEAFIKEDTYKVDLDVRFQYFDDTNVSILPRPDLGVGQGILDFKLISGIDNVKQALKNRLECPQGGLILHKDYGLPVLLGKKNTLEQLILLRYNLYSQLISDARVRNVNDVQIESKNDSVVASASAILVNNDDVLIKTTL